MLRSLRGMKARSRGPAFLFCSVLGAGVAGCASGDLVMMATIASGEKVRVPLSRAGAELTNQDGVQINKASFTLSPEKKIIYVFEFTDSRHRPLRSVRVEDVTDAPAIVLIEDSQPKPSAGGQWHGEVPPLEVTDRRLAWMATISNTVRVFQFTLTFSDGRTLVLHQGAFFPAGMKSAVRQACGLKD